jgi:hypothetical protein
MGAVGRCTVPVTGYHGRLKCIPTLHEPACQGARLHCENKVRFRPAGIKNSIAARSRRSDRDLE